MTRQQLIDLIINAKRTDPETGSFTEYLADFLIGYGVTLAPTREQVERLRGEWIKYDGYTECSRCEYWYPSSEDEEEGDRNPFCPACGAPMTDKAVEILMKRLEVICK